MFKKRIVMATLLLVGSALSSCGESVHPLSDYVRELSYKDGFKILQLADIHWNMATNVKTQSDYLSEVVRVADPDLIVCTGDQFLTANQATVLNLFKLFESWNIPYAMTWGNHDRQGDYSPEFLSLEASKGKNSLYTEVNDLITGRSNYVINIKSDTKVEWQIYCIDSNSVIADGLSLKYSYDYIHDDQIVWYTQQAEAAKTANGGSYVPSLSYFHIPTWEFKASKEDDGTRRSKEWGTLNEGFSTSKTDSKFFDAAKARGTKGMFIGHDHANDYTSTYDGVVLGYGVKTGRELYYSTVKKEDRPSLPHDIDLIGGSLVTLHQGGSFDLEHLFISDSTYECIREAY